MWLLGGYVSFVLVGMVGWNDNSGVSCLVCVVLIDLVGIMLLMLKFVWNVFICYFLLVVFVNWFVFKLLWCVEWVWVVVFVMLVIGVIIVVWMVLFDIGFVCS